MSGLRDALADVMTAPETGEERNEGSVFGGGPRQEHQGQQRTAHVVGQVHKVGSGNDLSDGIGRSRSVPQTACQVQGRNDGDNGLCVT